MLTTRLTPSRFNATEGDIHAGYVTVQGFNGYLLYGLTGRLNLLIRLPYLIWRQRADEANAHHRTETIAGLQDLNLGVRWVVRNQAFGPGQRLFVGMNLSLPTAPSYDVNPFGDAADSVQHTHFALGRGHFSGDLNAEWWYRSEFLWVLGISGNYYFPLNTSSLGYRSGQQVSLSFQGIRQKPLVRNTFLYLKLSTRWETREEWEDTPAPNSGGLLVDGLAGLNFEFSEDLSGVLAFQYPLWRTLEGAQLDPLALSFSIRRLMP